MKHWIVPQTVPDRSALSLQQFLIAGNEALREILGGQWVAEMEALPLVALSGSQEFELLVCFHALGNNPLLEAFPHSDHGGHDGCIVRIGNDVAHE